MATAMRWHRATARLFFKLRQCQDQVVLEEPKNRMLIFPKRRSGDVRPGIPLSFHQEPILMNFFQIEVTDPMSEMDLQLQLLITM